MKKLITAVLGGTVVATLAFASASALQVDGGTLQFGQDGVTCDADGVKANWGLETGTNDVRSVRITGIDPSCKGAEMFIKVDDRPHLKMVLTDAESQSVDFPAPFPAPDAIHGVRIWIEG